MTSELSLNRAIGLLYSVPTPTFQYRQRIDLRNPYSDLAYSHYIQFHPDHETVVLTFPPECHTVLRMKNSHGCKMVFHEFMDGFVHETEINDQTQFFYRPSTSVTIYTRSIRDLVISFEMILIKPTFRSKL